MLIGEVAERSGISPRMLRYYDKIGLVTPSARTPSGYRQYTDEDLNRLFHVEGLRSLGLDLKEIVTALDGTEFAPAAMVDHLIARTHERVAREQELLRTLRQVRATAPDRWVDVLGTIALLRGLNAPNPSDRQRLALSLWQVSGPDVGVLAEAALSESDPIVAATLSWALARTGDRAVPTLADALGSASAERRRRAVTALDKIGTPGSRQALARALGHPDHRVNDRAALECGAAGDPAAIPALVSMIVRSRRDIEAAELLGSLAVEHGCAGQVDRAVGAALAGGEPGPRLRLTSALSLIPGEHTRTRLVSLTEDGDPQVARSAREALRILDDPQSSG